MKILNLLIILLITSCSTSTNNGIRIETNPTGASVVAIGGDGQQTSLGKTPIQMTEQEFFRGEKLLQIQTILPGYKEAIVFVPRSDRLKDASLTIILKEQISSETKNSEKLNTLVGELAQGQALIHQKKFAQAEQILQKQAREFPDVAVIRDLLGNALYLNGRSKEALEVYLKAEALDPNNNARKVIINKIKGQ
jgi:tetratricopeptide (TPR) repeat protein